ncbi:MAG: glycosyltransferase [Deltaproteobacteria bacterium]|nr:glycosyltransferase [Deltaproteobacteria bacterium]
MNKSELISIVIPVFNEAGSLDELIRRCLDICHTRFSRFEIILVDDGSTDGSADMICNSAGQHPGEIIGVLLNRNYGQHAAIMAGFEKSTGDIVVTLDADLQNPPEEIGKLVEKIMQGFDVVGSVRKDRQDSIFRRLASASINRVVRSYTGVDMHDYGCMLRAYRRHIVDAMLSCHEHSTFIPVLANSFAGKTAEVEVGHEKRTEGDSKYSLWKLINLQFDLLTSMSTLPLRLLSVVGVLISATGIGFGLFLFVMRLIHGPGWAAQGVFTLFAALFIFIGFQFIGMGLLGEYIGRMYHDVRGRPRYFVCRVAGEIQDLKVVTASATKPADNENLLKKS